MADNSYRFVIETTECFSFCVIYPASMSLEEQEKAEPLREEIIGVF